MTTVKTIGETPIAAERTSELDQSKQAGHEDGTLECRQIEVQASVRPVSYVTDLPKAVQKETGRRPKSSKERSESEIRQGIAEWIAKKFDAPAKVRLRTQLVPTGSPWTRELVLHKVKHEQEVVLFQEAGVTILRLVDIVADLKGKPGPQGPMIAGAAGSHLMDLIGIGAERSYESGES